MFILVASSTTFWRLEIDVVSVSGLKTMCRVLDAFVFSMHRVIDSKEA